MPNKVSGLREKVDVRLAVMRMTKAELAGVCGCSPQSLNSLLNQGNPKVGTLCAMADALKVDVAVFFEEGVPASLLQVAEPAAAPAKRERRKKAEA
jgi:transcriptional regulator with XRE-family HTH domain